MKSLFWTLCLCCSLTSAYAAQRQLTMEQAQIVVVGDDPVVQKAAEVFSDEVARHTRLRLHPTEMPTGVFVLLGIEPEIVRSYPELQPMLDALPATGAEGYKLLTVDERIIIAGHDRRGVMYGVGALLRRMHMTIGKASLYAFEGISSTPQYAIRGHEMQSSPRAKNPTEQWAVANFEQLVRELVLYGMNAVETLRTIPAEYAEIIQSYGIDHWIVTYQNGPDFESAAGEAAELRMRERVFQRYRKIDHWFIKSGDPGDLTLDRFFTFVEKEVALLKKYHPEAKVWLGPQHFKDAPKSYFEEFVTRTNAAQWVDGVVFGPWCRMPFAELRKKLRADIPIRNFPDITHIYSCQYPIKDIDHPLAQSLGRICINPTPEAQKFIHNYYAPLGVGSLTYSEGTNDDLNKFFWLMQDWNPTLSAEECVLDYARYFIGEELAEAYTKGTFMLERNLSGALEKNAAILETLAHWQQLEQQADERTMRNPRFLMPLLRAHYDAYIYIRWQHELAIEREALAKLTEAPKRGAQRTMNEARAILDKVHTCADPALRKRIDELYAAVYRDEPRWTMEYQRCPLMDQIDRPLADSEWLLYNFKQIEQLASNKERLAAINKLLHRTDPGEGGFYYNLGDYSTESITGIEAGYTTDPSHLETPHCGLGVKMLKGFIMTANGFSGHPIPRAWHKQVGIYYDQPLTLTFEGFDPAASYRVRIVYTGEANKFNSHVRCDAEGVLLQPTMRLEGDVVKEYDLPQAVSADGRVTLRWQSAEGERGCHIAEIMFLKNQPEKRKK